MQLRFGVVVAVAAALIRLPTWELPYAAGMAMQRKLKKKNKKKERKRRKKTNLK